MRWKQIFPGYLAAMLWFCGCSGKPSTQAAKDQDSLPKGTYGYDIAFLKRYAGQTLELRSTDGRGRVLLSPAFQGRVLTSTADGDSGASFGWINYSLISRGIRKKAFNPYGGEERFWMGPEGGQFSLYFHKGDSFNIAHWQVPAFLDTLPWELAESGPANAYFRMAASFPNYSGSVFSLQADRRISLLTREAIENKLRINLPDSIKFVGFESENKVTNNGKEEWNKNRGLLSIWLLGMFNPSPGTFVIIPFRNMAGAKNLITQNYFGEIPPARLHILDSVLYFYCDGKYRSKIGISPRIAKAIAGSFDIGRNILTLVLPELYPASDYVNSKWEIQQDPFRGDALNSYNDGPLKDGSQLGPFYELESSSPALALKPGGSAVYRSVTCHFQGNYASLKQLTLRLLGFDLDKLKKDEPLSP
jgi:hypothetical protein